MVYLTGRHNVFLACLVLATRTFETTTDAFMPISLQRSGSVRTNSDNKAQGLAFTPVQKVSLSTATALRMEVIDCDVVIVGGGPAGCTCALYTSRGGHKTVIVDKNPAAGALAITSTIANYPGVDPTISGEALLQNMRDQAVEYGTDYRRAQVFMVDFDEEKGVQSVFTPDFTVNAKTLVLATGALGRKPTYKGEGEFLGSGVSYCATCDGAFMSGCPVTVVGDTLEAIEEAEFLTKFASVVHWVTPRKIAADNIPAQRLIAEDNVKLWENTKLNYIEGNAAGVTGVEIKQKGKDEVEKLEVEGAFIYAAGSKPITDYIGSKIDFKDDGGVIVNEEMATNVPGVYAIGDIRNTPFKQVVVAAGDGCVAAMAIDKYIKGRKNFKVDWIHQ
jgi:thioredoxin reductase (NADPH)